MELSQILNDNPGLIPQTALASPALQYVDNTHAGIRPIASGVNFVALTTPLTEELQLGLPLANSDASYLSTGIVVVDARGASNETNSVTVVPPSGNTLNGGTAAVTILAGIGTASIFSDGSNSWATGQSYMNAPTARGLVLSTLGATMDDRMLSVRNATGREVFSVENNHTVRAVDLLVEEQFSSDLGNIYTNGEGIFNTARSVNAPTVYTNLSQFLEPKEVSDVAVYVGQAALFFGTDGKLHCVTEGGEDHVLSWTPAV